MTAQPLAATADIFAFRRRLIQGIVHWHCCDLLQERNVARAWESPKEAGGGCVYYGAASGANAHDKQEGKVPCQFLAGPA
jgi:hypothetical protein